MAIDPIHPGAHIQEELDAMQISAEDFAERLRLPIERLSHVIRGDEHLDADMALRLGHFFGMSPDFWLRLQNQYDLRVVEMRDGEAIQSLPTFQQSKAA